LKDIPLPTFLFLSLKSLFPQLSKLRLECTPLLLSTRF
jgi:hypothetical protein